MIKNKQFLIILTLGIITIGLFTFIAEVNEKEMVINGELLNSPEIEYIEVVGSDDNSLIKINDSGDIEKIILLLQQLNGSVELEHLPADKPLLALHIARKGHFPSSAIMIYQDKIFHGKGRNISGKLVNEFVKTIESSF